MASDWEVAEELPADDGWQVESATPAKRRGGTLGEVRAAGQTGRGAGGFAEADPRRLDTRPTQNIPLPEGVEPSRAGAGRGVVNPLAAAVSRASDTYANRDEAIGDAVDRIESGTPPEDVFSAFQQMGVSRDEIVARGQQLGGRMFRPQQAEPVAQRRFSNTGGRDTVVPRDINAAQDIANTLGRGAEQFKQSIDAAQFQAGGIDGAEMAERMRASQRRMGAMAPADATRAGLERLQQADATGSWGEVLSAAANPQNWRALSALVAESAVATAPAIVANGIAQALTGGVGGMPAAAATTFAQEYTAAVAEELSKRGIDASDPVRVAAALADPDIREAIDQRGRIRGAAVGAFGALTMGAAGAIGRTMARLNAAGRLTRGRAAAGAAGGAAVGIGGDMAGEAVAQAGVGEDKPLEVLVEGLAGAPGGVAEVAGAAIRRPRTVAEFLTPPPAPATPDKPAAPIVPTEAKAGALKRFDELAAAHGFNSAAVQRAKQAAADMPADEVPAFLERLTDALQKRGLVAKPIDEQSLGDLAATIDPPPQPEAPPATEKEQAAANIEGILRGAGALPDEALPTTLEDLEPPRIEGEPISRNWTAFAPESGTLAIPREQMPQIDAAHRGALVNFLAARGIAHELETVPADTLKPTQREFSPGKVKGMAGEQGSRSILVSSDDHILDGHHQWLARREAGEPVKVIRLDAPIQDLLRLAHQFPSSTTASTRRKAPDAPVPDVADAAERVSGAGAAGAGAADGSQRAVGSVADDAQRADAGDPAAPAAGGAPDLPAGRDRAADTALTPAAQPEPPAAAPEPARRILGRYGRTPTESSEIELRPNDDGTVTPWTGKYPMVDFETGDPIKVPAEATDAEVVDAIRTAKAVTPRDKFFGVKSSAAPVSDGQTDAPEGGRGQAEQRAATQQAKPDVKAELDRRMAGVKALIACLGK